MPNWVKNIVNVSEDTMNKIKEKCFTDGVLDFNKIIPMPKTLDLPEGSITDRAIYYAYIKKDVKTKKEIKKILQGTSDFIYKNYWNELENYKKLGHFDNIQDSAKNFKASDYEKDLNIHTLEELGDMYIQNIKEYGYTSWYNWRIDNWGTKWNATDFSCNKTTMIFYTAWATPEAIFEKLSEMFPNRFIEIKYADECYSNYNNGIITYENGLEQYESEMDEDFSAEVWDEEIENENDKKDIADEMYG